MVAYATIITEVLRFVKERAGGDGKSGNRKRQGRSEERRTRKSGGENRKEGEGDGRRKRIKQRNRNGTATDKTGHKSKRDRQGSDCGSKAKKIRKAIRGKTPQNGRVR